MNFDRANWKTLAITAAIALASSVALTFSRPVELRVDGQNIVSDVPPVTQRNEVFVPLRAMADALGAEMAADPTGNHVELIRGDQQLHINVGSTAATLNGAKMTLRHAPFRARGRVMVGLRTISRAFAVKTSYDRRTARIDVQSPGVIEESSIKGTP